MSYQTRSEAAFGSHAPTRRSRVIRLVSTIILSFSLLTGLLIGCSDSGATAEEGRAADPAMTALDAYILEHPVTRTAPGWKTRLRKPPQVEFNPESTYVWKLITSQGEIKIRMMTDIAPMHVSSTFYLTRLGFYDGTIFHRVLQGFMAQGGDPLGTGRGTPGYKYKGEFDKTVRHDAAGTLSMANAGPRTDGSQFFLTFAPTPGLDDKHTVFGRIEDPDSMAVLRKIEALGVMRDPGRPTQKITIKRATILIE